MAAASISEEAQHLAPGPSPAARLGGVLGGALGIRAGEGGRAGWVGLVFAATQAGHGIGANTADALFLVRFGVEFLPLLILASGGVVLVATVGYMAGLARVGAARWLPLTMWGLASWLVLERAGIAAGVPGIYPVVWLGAQVAIFVSLTVLWNAAAEVSTMRQAKRLYPLFASAGILGGVFGNGLTGPLALRLGTENLLLVHAGLFAAAAAALQLVARRYFAGSNPVGRSGRTGSMAVVGDLGRGLAVIRTTPLLRLAAAVAFALSVLFFLVSFPFSEVVARTFTSEADVATYLGRFSAAVTAVTFLVSLLAANRLLAALGVVATLLIVPAVYAAGFGLLLVTFGLTSATLVRGAQWVAVNAIATTAQSALLNVLPAHHRSPVLAFMTGVPAQLGTMASGALLLAGQTLPPSVRAITGLIVAIFTSMLVLRMRPAYAGALLDAVRQGLGRVLTTPAATPAAQQRLDADVRRACSAGLEDPRAGARAVVAGMLASLEPGQAAPLVSRALADPDPRVRVAALDAVAQQATSGELAGGLLRDPSPLVRRRALAILEGRGEHLAASAAAVLADPDAEVRAAAAALAGPGRGTAVLGAMLASGEPTQMTAALHALARRPGLRDGAAVHLDVMPLADHPDRGVRAATAGVLAGDSSATAVLRRLLDDPSIRVRTASAAALVASQATVGTLLDVLESGSVRASDAAVSALSGAGLGGERLRRWIAGEVERARYLRHHGTALRSTPPDRAPLALTLLADVLLSRHDRLTRWALLAMSTPRTEPALVLVRRGIRSSDPQVRGQALEALEAVADHGLTRGLLALLEDDVPVGDDARSSLRVLAQDTDAWIRALAVRCLVEDIQADLAHLHAAIEGDGSELVRSALPRWRPPPMEPMEPMEETASLDTVERVVALHQVTLFSELDPEDLERVARVTIERRYDPGEAIFAFGAKGEEMLLVLAGQVEVRRPDGRPLRTFGAWQPVGELAVLSGGNRSADVVAGEDGVHGLVLGAGELMAIIEERPQVALAMLATLAARLREA